MYSVLLSKIELGIDLIKNELKSVIKETDKVAIFPWAFPTELTSEQFEQEYFKVNERRYNKYINELKKLNLKEKNVVVCNPYKHTKKELKEIIKNSNILLFPGGNPEMFFEKVLHDTELIYEFKNYKGIVIGESAGTELQLKRYFITSKNNYYGYFAFYDGFGLIDNDFYIDVHTINDKEYMEELYDWSKKINKVIYGISDNGAIIYNRETKVIKKFGDVIKISCKE